VRPGTFDHTIQDDCRTEGIAPAKTHWARAIDTPPFYAYPLRPGITFTYLGVGVDARARMILADGRPAANVWAAGEIMAGNILGKGYLAGIGMAIGTTFGVGDGSTTFNVPDLRGEFVRGWDDARGVDSGRVFGSAQTDLLRNHTHDYQAPSISASMTTGASNNVLTSASTATGNPNGGLGGAETRPRNIALLKCIKF